MESTTIDDLLRADTERDPESLALADAPNRASFFTGDPVRFTWADLDASVGALASDLAGLGAGPAAPVAIQLPNVAELVTTVLACCRIGATAVPFPIQHREHELAHGLGVSRPALFVTGARPDRPDLVDEIAAVIAAGPGDVVLAAFGDVPDRGATGVERLALRSDGPRDERVAAADDVATVCWTSGTTGTPKGVPRTNAMWLAAGRFQVDELGLTSDDRILCPFPIVNMAGIGGMLVPWLLSGAAFHLHQPLDLPVFLQQASSEQITYTVAPPPLLNMLLANPGLLDSVDISSLRRIGSGSAPLDPAMVTGWQQRGVEIVNIFGSNEGAALLSTQATVDDPERRARFFPRPNASGVQIRLVDLATEDEITAPGTVGELRFAGPTVFDGYLESDGSEFDDDGYFRTGDLFEWVDESATLLRFVDRAKDIIIRGGMNISAAEVEGLLSGHAAVGECAAVGYPDADLGERLGVFVVAAPDANPTLDDLIEHLRGRGVASYKLPERIEIVEALPRNPVGKVTKPELRTRWAVTP
ncbi:class I adenylate-forming enzyme family protein [Ilumatobacter sp.]|uniref:class I adenylate-forming enzyme family protein n=1 Tax=Ilumatobacter sp. TaxID=1967498 RepID=UPI003C5AD551